MNCSKCGGNIEKTDAFCGNCGAKIEHAEAHRATQSTDADPYAPATVGAAAEAPAAAAQGSTYAQQPTYAQRPTHIQAPAAAAAPATAEPATASATQASPIGVSPATTFATHTGAQPAATFAAPAPTTTSTVPAPSAAAQPPANTSGTHALRNTVIVCSIVLLVVVAFVAGLCLSNKQSQNEITLDSQTIGDEPLLNTLKAEYDKDGDGKLTGEEIGHVENLDLNSGADYSFIYLFYNLKQVNVKNTEVSKLDFSKNTCLTRINCRDATNVREIYLPNLTDYSGVELPESTDLQVTFPDDSEYEMKYVPKRVEETTCTSNTYKPTTKTKVYEQDVISLTKIASLKCYEDSKLSQDITYNYSNAGTITSWGDTTNITYDENNRVSGETSKLMSVTAPTTRHAAYAEDGSLTSVATEGEANRYSRSDDGQTLTLLIDGASSGAIENYWKFDGSNLREYLCHIGNGSNYLKRSYDWADNVTNKEKIEVLDSSSYSSSGGGSSLNTPEPFNNMPTTSTDTATFVHNGHKLLEANYDSGFSQKFEYDANANLVKVTSSGAPSVNNVEFTTSCTIEYARMIGKKDQKPLNFLVLPGKELQGTFHESVEVRGITLAGITSGNSPFSQDFAGKFWWDAETIINAQLQAPRTENPAATTNTADATPQDEATNTTEQKPEEQIIVNPVDAKIAELETQGYTVYRGSVVTHTGLAGSSAFNALKLDEPQTITYGGEQYGTVTNQVSEIILNNKQYADGEEILLAQKDMLSFNPSSLYQTENGKILECKANSNSTIIRVSDIS